MTPLLDGHLAGFLAKLSTITVLWTVAFGVVVDPGTRPPEPTGEDVDPLMWSDVKHEIEQAESVASSNANHGPIHGQPGCSPGRPQGVRRLGHWN